MADKYKVKLTRNVGINGESFKAGEEVELSESDAGLIVSIGKGQLLTGPKVRVQAGQSVSGKRA